MFETLRDATTGKTIDVPLSVGETKANLFTVFGLIPETTSLVEAASIAWVTWATEASGFQPK